MSLHNIEARMYRTDGQIGFHTKGYLFKKDDLFHLIIGSSNMTEAALTMNKEWNIKVVSTKNGELLRKAAAEWQGLWESSHTVAVSDYIEALFACEETTSSS